MNHKGFIPWDDDVDISMMQQDYDVFCNILSHSFSEKYHIITFDNTDDYYSKLNKLLIKGGTLYYSDGTCSPIFIDLSIFHAVPEQKIQRHFQRYELEMLDKILGVKAGKITPTSLKAHLFLKPLSKINKKKLGKVLDKVLCRYDGKCSNAYALMIHMLPNPYTGMNGYDNDTVSARLLHNPQYMQFEDTEFMVYSDPLSDLIRRYGPDYAKPYPEEKRISKHSVVRYELSDELKKRVLL